MIHKDIFTIQKDNFIECPFPFHPELRFDDPTPIFRRKFHVCSVPQRAVLQACCLGFGCVFLNGNPISEDLFTAPVSNYNKTFGTIHMILLKVKPKSRKNSRSSPLIVAEHFALLFLGSMH